MLIMQVSHKSMKNEKNSLPQEKLYLVLPQPAGQRAFLCAD